MSALSLQKMAQFVGKIYDEAKSGITALSQMSQHNSHVVNKTNQVIKVCLTDSGNRNSTAVIQPGQHVCFPTPRGRVTLQAGSSRSSGYQASYSDDSDYSFIVKAVGGALTIVRSAYGNIHQEASGMR